MENLDEGPLYLGPKSENFRPSTNKLEESRCIFFGTIVLKTRNIIYSIVFFIAFILVYCFSWFFKYLVTFYSKVFKSIMTELSGGGEGVCQKIA